MTANEVAVYAVIQVIPPVALAAAVIGFVWGGFRRWGAEVASRLIRRAARRREAVSGS